MGFAARPPGSGPGPGRDRLLGVGAHVAPGPDRIPRLHFRPPTDSSGAAARPGRRPPTIGPTATRPPPGVRTGAGSGRTSLNRSANAWSAALGRDGEWCLPADADGFLTAGHAACARHPGGTPLGIRRLGMAEGIVTVDDTMFEGMIAAPRRSLARRARRHLRGPAGMGRGHLAPCSGLWDRPRKMSEQLLAPPAVSCRSPPATGDSACEPGAVILVPAPPNAEHRTRRGTGASPWALGRREGEELGRPARPLEPVAARLGRLAASVSHGPRQG